MGPARAPFGIEPELEQRIADVVVAEQKPGVGERDQLRRVVGLGSRAFAEWNGADFFHG